MNLNSPARYLFDLYGRKIKDISKGKWQRFCKLYDNIMKGIYILLFLLYTFKRKTDIIKELINMNNIFFLQREIMERHKNVGNLLFYLVLVHLGFYLFIYLFLLLFKYNKMSPFSSPHAPPIPASHPKHPID